jgi:hypothetical protein
MISFFRDFDTAKLFDQLVDSRLDGPDFLSMSFNVGCNSPRCCCSHSGRPHRSRFQIALPTSVFSLVAVEEIVANASPPGPTTAHPTGSAIAKSVNIANLRM